MAIVEVKVPQLSESVAEATLLQWKKKAGEAVAVDEILIEIETDKVVLEVPAPSAGVLVEIVQADGATVACRAVDRPYRHRSHRRCSGPSRSASACSRRSGACAPAAAAAATGGSKAGVAMPAAAKLMADNNLAAGSVAGSGKDGRVTKGDVLAAVAGGGAKSVAAPVAIPTGAPTKVLPQVPMVSPDLGDRPEERVPMTRLRARVAERLLQSQATNAILTTFNEINMAPGHGDAQAHAGALREGTRREAGLHELLRQGRCARAEEIPGAQRFGGRQRHRVPRLLRHRYRGGFAPWSGGAHLAQCRPDELCRHRKEDR